MVRVLQAPPQTSSNSFVIVGVDSPAAVDSQAAVEVFLAVVVAGVAFQDLVAAADSPALAADSPAEAAKVAVVVVMVIEDQGRIRT